ncbi:hypothetical protein JL09_g6831 [Pichia kudriavzevii]|uniref:Uncharacterized protein n=1 Tax=Pichia kudriavzevii TaxID=4909 RepID=A0A099NKW2_PICKU|nr:hypothetical protein JL09_g6831 [Pichia kudriavzevii]
MIYRIIRYMKKYHLYLSNSTDSFICDKWVQFTSENSKPNKFPFRR